MRARHIIAAGIVVAVLAPGHAGADIVPPSQHRTFVVDPGDTWASIAAEAGVTGTGNATDSIVDTGADKVQVRNNLAATTSDTAQPRVGWELNLPPASPPPATTTTTSTTAPPPPPSSTTTTAPATTTTAAATTTSTSSSTTSTTAAPTTTAPTTTTQPATTTTVGGGDPPSFLATFATAGDFYDRFQLDVHFRDVVSGSGENVGWDRALSGDHDMGCAGPTTQRQFHPRQAHDMPGDNSGDDHRNSELYWWCAPAGPDSGHVMTGMGDVDGYTILAFSPHQRFDGAKKVCWDVNPTNISERKWYGVAIISEAHYQATGGRLDYVGDPGVDEFALNPGDGEFMFLFQDQNFRSFWNPPGYIASRDGTDINDFTRQPIGYRAAGVRDEAAEFNVYGDKATRNKHCLTENAGGTITIEQYRGPNVAGAGADGFRRQTVTGSFPDQARVIFLDDSYTPGKDETVSGLTWHWDSISIS
jgi:hypothetical protein